MDNTTGTIEICIDDTNDTLFMNGDYPVTISIFMELMK